MIVSVTVAKDGTGFSAFGFDEKHERIRLSPSWLRETFEEVLQEFEVPSQNDKKKTVKIKRIAPRKTGHKVVYGESLVTATERAKKALEAIAVGKQPKIPPTKEVPRVA